MNVSAWSIRNPIPAVMLFALLTFGGLVSYRSMMVQNLPDMDLPVVIVSAGLSGASPSQLETDVARKLEYAIATVHGLKHITTVIQDGSVSISAEFGMETPVQDAVDDIRSALSTVRDDLPSDMRDPVVSKMDVAGVPILAYTVSSSRRDDEALSWFVDNTVTKRLLAEQGVGSVRRVGGVKRQITVALEPVKIQSINASIADISRQLRLVQQDSAGGHTDLGDGQQPVRTISGVSSVEELRNLELSLSNGRRVRLGQLGTVTDTVADPSSVALLNGKPVVGFEISRSKGASELDAAVQVQKVLDELGAANPDVHFSEVYNFVDPVKESFDGSMTMLYDGGILAVLVVWLFLKDSRATLISAVALPMSVIPAFLGMDYFGFSLNVLTLLSLSLVIGILVDDAIVEVENIMRHLRMGKTPYQAAMEAANEIGLAVVATTLALVAVFLPTAFMSGMVGRFFKQFGLTATVAILASLLVARVLTPMMAAYMLKVGSSDREETDGRIKLAYMRAVAWCLGNRLAVTIGAGAFFIGSLFLIPLLPQGFMPPNDESQTLVTVELSPGVTLAETLEAAEAARILVATVPYVKSIYTNIGGGSAGSDPSTVQSVSEVRQATLNIMLYSGKNRSVSKEVVEQNIRKVLVDLPGVRTKVGSGSGGQYSLMLSGDDPRTLNMAATAVERDIRSIPGLGSVVSSADLVRPEILFRPDLAQAADLGVNTAMIGETLRIATVGDYDMSLPKLNLTRRQVPVVVKLAADSLRDLSALKHLAVPSSKPAVEPVMLEQVAQLQFTSGPTEINRYDRARDVKIEAELSGLPLGEVTKMVQNLPSVRNLPSGVKQISTGDAQDMADLFTSFSIAMLAGALCIFVVLVLLFKDFLQPITILMALPLSFGGSFVALLATDRGLSLPSLIGLVMLMGIASKNSILLVEYTILARRDHGLNRLDALLEACNKRSRPIVMTSIAMAAGMLPIALGTGSADSPFRSPMAIAVIGGLITSTLLSLFVIPVAYTYMDDFEGWIKSPWQRAATQGHGNSSDVIS